MSQNAVSSPIKDASSSWGTGDFVRLFEDDLIGAPRWFQAIHLNRPQVFKVCMQSWKDTFGAGLEYKGRSPLEWAVRLGRVGITRALLKGPVDQEAAGLWLLDSLTDRWQLKPPQGIWSALVQAGVVVRARHLSAAAGRCDAAGDRFYRQHVTGVLGPLGPAFFLLLGAGVSLPGQRDPARSFERAMEISCPSQRPVAGSMMRVIREWITAVHTAPVWEKDRIPAFLEVLPLLVRHWDSGESGLIDALYRLAAWRPEIEKGRRASIQNPGPEVKDAVVSASLEVIGSHKSGPALGVNAALLGTLVSVGPRSAHAILNSAAFTPQAQDSIHRPAPVGLSSWIGEISHQVKSQGSSEKGRLGVLARQWASDISEQAGERAAFFHAEDWASGLAQMEPSLSRDVLKGLFDWWDPSPTAQHFLWAQMARHWVRGGEGPEVLLSLQAALLEKGLSAQEGLEALLEKMEGLPGVYDRLNRVVRVAVEALIEAGAQWHTPRAQAAWEKMVSDHITILSPGDKSVLESWKMDRELGSTASVPFRKPSRL